MFEALTAEQHEEMKRLACKPYNSEGFHPYALALHQALNEVERLKEEGAILRASASGDIDAAEAAIRTSERERISREVESNYGCIRGCGCRSGFQGRQIARFILNGKRLTPAEFNALEEAEEQAWVVDWDDSMEAAVRSEKEREHDTPKGQT